MEDLFNDMMKKAMSDEPTITPLIQAVTDNQYEKVKELLDKRVDINETDIVGFTALMYASMKGYIHIVKLLLKHSANINYTLQTGTNAISLAKSEGHQKVIDILSNKKICDLCYKAITSSEMAIVPSKIVKQAVKNGWRPSNDDLIGIIGKTVGFSEKELEQIFYSQVMSDNSDWGLCSNCESKYFNSEKELVSKTKIEDTAVKHEDQEVDEDNKISIWFTAIENEDIKAVNNLIDLGYNANTQDMNGESALMKVAKIGNLDLIVKLLKSKVNVNTLDKSGNTALHFVFGYEAVASDILKNAFTVFEKDGALKNTESHAEESIIRRAKCWFTLIQAGADSKVRNEKGDYPEFPKEAKKIKEAKENSSNEGAKETNNSNKGNCFIATAIYGDYNHPNVILLRYFRDSILLNNSLGKLFVKVYYKIGPKMAEVAIAYPSVKFVFSKMITRLLIIISKK